MAEKRMFAKTIIDSDIFLGMPLTTQALYFHLSMRADDEGFVNSPKRIMRMVGANDGDIELLIRRNFLITFDSGVVVIKHWRIHNYIQTDRFKKTVYVEERSQIELKENKSYTKKTPNITDVIHPVSNLDTDCIHSIDKIRLEENRLDKIRLEESNSGAEPPQIPYQEIIDYLNLRTSKRFKVTGSVKANVNARFKEGFTIQDFKDVIDKKCIEWISDKKMKQYLRPQTLFGTKFDSYLNQDVNQPQSSNPYVDILQGGGFDESGNLL